MDQNGVWEKIFSTRDWGKYPGEPLIKFVAKNFYKTERSKIKFLEIGSGPGANIWFLTREGFQVDGIECSPSAIMQTYKRLEDESLTLKGNIIEEDVRNIWKMSDKYDGIIDNECICCLNRHDAELAYSHIAKLLKPNGHLFVRTFANGTYGESSGKKIDDRTWECAVGPMANMGQTRFCHKSDFATLFKDELYEIEHCELISETIDNMQKTVNEWVLYLRPKS